MLKCVNQSGFPWIYSLQFHNDSSFKQTLVELDIKAPVEHISIISVLPLAKVLRAELDLRRKNERRLSFHLKYFENISFFLYRHPVIPRNESEFAMHKHDSEMRPQTGLSEPSCIELALLAFCRNRLDAVTCLGMVTSILNRKREQEIAQQLDWKDIIRNVSTHRDVCS